MTMEKLAATRALYQVFEVARARCCGDDVCAQCERDRVKFLGAFVDLLNTIEPDPSARFWMVLELDPDAEDAPRRRRLEAVASEQLAMFDEAQEKG